MISLKYLLLSFLTLSAFAASDYRTERENILFGKSIGFTRIDESSGATLNALSSNSSYIKLTSTVTTINGMTAPSASVSRFVVISNMTGGEVTVNHQNVSATASNRFDLPSATNIKIPDKGSATFIYDHGAQRWVQASIGAGSVITELTGDVTAGPGSGSQVATIAANAITDSKFRQSAGLSVVGRSANTTGNVADISAASDNQILRRSGTSIGFGSIDLSQSGAVGSSILGTANGGTGINSTATFPNSGTVATVPSAGVVKSNGSVLSSSNVNLASEVTGTLPIANGGTALTAVGSADQLFGTNAGATAFEHKAVTATAAGALTAAGSIRAQGALITDRRDESSGATVNALDSTQSFVNVTGTVTTINGAVAGTSGQILAIHNQSASAITVSHQSGSATAANRFALPDASNQTIGAGETRSFIYNGSTSRWVPYGGGGGGGGNVLVTGTRSSPQAIIAGGGITITAGRNEDIYIQGSGGSVDITANPQISAGSVDGERKCFIGRSDTNTVIIDNGNGVSQDGSIELGVDDIACYRWDTTNWVNVSVNF